MHNAVDQFSDALKAWAAKQPDILAAAIVGSHARGTARPGSDIDVVMIVDDPARYLEAQAWLEHFGRVRSVSDENWGLLQSRRIHYADGMEVEFGITVREWANINPVDSGTRKVVADGMRILYDREMILRRLLNAVAANA